VILNKATKMVMDNIAGRTGPFIGDILKEELEMDKVNFIILKTQALQEASGKMVF
jgi:hypothetical protein